MSRIGVFICECGPNLKAALDIPQLVRTAARLEGVVHAGAIPLLCVPEAGPSLSTTIRTHAIDRVVFAGCSPREHEHTYREIAAAAGLNPYLVQTANIREQCAWVIHDRRAATRQARALIRGAVGRVRHHEPLIGREIASCQDVLVVGAGVAGISAARTLARNDRRVFLVERSACIGGKAALYEDLYPDLNCAACLIEPDLDAVLHDARIDVITLGEVEAARGFPGNFTVTVKQHPRRIDAGRCIGCTACMEACPVTLPNEINAGLDRRTAVGTPYPGALPHVAVIDPRHCRRFHGEACTRCRDACPVDAVDYDQAATTRELAVGAVVIAAGFRGFDPDRDPRYGHAALKNVISAQAFERMVNTSGPTHGTIVTADGRPPRQVAFVHCVGSRSGNFNAHCSGVCCLTAFKHARQVKRQLPDSAVHHVVADLCLPGKTAQRFFDRLQADTGITLHRMARPGAVRIEGAGGNTVVLVTDPSGGKRIVEADLVVLATAMEPPDDARQLARIFDIALDADGFFAEAHPVTAPVGASREGLYLAGCCRGPADIPASVAQGQAAAGAVHRLLVPGGTIALDPVVARVEAERCSGCRTCESLCPFGAVVADEAGRSVAIEDALCRGCGICVAACPSGAIVLCHFSRDAVAAELAGLLRSDEA